jgi:hypothetical protein
MEKRLQVCWWDGSIVGHLIHREVSGKWSLTPAYDMTFSPGLLSRGMSVADEIWPLPETMQTLCRDAGMSREEYQASFEAVDSSLQKWPELAKASGVPEGKIREVSERFSRIRGKVLQGRLCAAVGDRGFDSALSRKKLEEEKAFNGLCPRDAKEMQRRLREDESFAGAQKRRAQTEGRIGILKNVFLQGTPRAKGFKNRDRQVDWAVLSHNLWVVARLPWACDRQMAAEAA